MYFQSSLLNYIDQILDESNFSINSANLENLYLSFCILNFIYQGKYIYYQIRKYFTKEDRSNFRITMIILLQSNIY